MPQTSLRSRLSQRFRPNLSRNDSAWIPAIALLSPYLLIAGLVWLAEKSGGWALKALTLPVIAALQNHLQILLHEGAHFQLHPRRRWNDLIANVFCATPFFGLLSHYRRFHLEHHKHLLDPEKDPEVGFYAEQGHFFGKKRPYALLKMFFLDLSGYHYFQFFFSYNRYLFQETRANRMPKAGRDELLAIIPVLTGTLAIVACSGGARRIFLYWLLPQATFLFFFLKLQGYGEHSARGAETESCTFTHELGFAARFFIYPLNSELHLEHHLYPSVPWYRLRRIHKRLLESSEEGAPCPRGYVLGQKSFLRTALLETAKPYGI